MIFATVVQTQVIRRLGHAFLGHCQGSLTEKLSAKWRIKLACISELQIVDISKWANKSESQKLTTKRYATFKNF